MKEKTEESGIEKSADKSVEKSGIDGDEYRLMAVSSGKSVRSLAEELLISSGFDISGRQVLFSSIGLTVSFTANDACGNQWYFDVTGKYSTPGEGLLTTGDILKTLGRVLVMHSAGLCPVILLSAYLPQVGSNAWRLLKTAGIEKMFDAIEILGNGAERLKQYGSGDVNVPLAGFWDYNDISTGIFRQIQDGLAENNGTPDFRKVPLKIREW